MNYPDTVARISKLLETPEIKDGERCGKTAVLLDLTGSGSASQITVVAPGVSVQLGGSRTQTRNRLSALRAPTIGVSAVDGGKDA